MKYILTVFLALFLIIPVANAQEEKIDDIVITVDGMVCDFCAQSLEKVFNKEEGVNGIVVSLDDQTVTVDTEEGQDVSDKKIKELIEWAGYDLVSINRGE